MAATARKGQHHCIAFEELWWRQMGELRPSAFARRVGGSQDLIQRLQLFAELDGHDGCVNTVHFNPSGEVLVSGSDDLQIVLWNWAAGSKKYYFNSGHVSNVFQAKVMPFSDDRYIISSGADGQVRFALFSESGLVETKLLAKHKGAAHKLAIEPGTSRTFLSSGEDGVVRHFDLREASSRVLLECHSFQGSSKSKRRKVRLNTININPINTVNFAVGGSDEYARIYDIRKLHCNGSEVDDTPVDTFVPKHLVGSGRVHITCLVFSNQQELLVSYNDESIYLFEKKMGLGANPKSQGNDEGGDSSEGPKVYKGHRNARTVKGVNFFGPNCEYVISGSDCGRIFIWKKSDSVLSALMKGDNHVVNCLEPHPHATILATSGIDSTVKIWTPTAHERIPLPSDAEKVMEQNQRRLSSRARLSLTPDVIMHVLRLQRRQEQFDLDEWFTPADYGSVDENADASYDYVELNSFDDDEDSLDEDRATNPSECIIS